MCGVKHRWPEAQVGILLMTMASMYLSDCLMTAPRLQFIISAKSTSTSYSRLSMSVFTGFDVLFMSLVPFFVGVQFFFQIHDVVFETSDKAVSVFCVVE